MSLCFIYYRNDGTGILDSEARNGDCLQILPDSAEATLGDQEKKSFLIIHIPDPPNKVAVEDALTESDYGIDAGGSPIVTRFRKFGINWRSKFTADEAAIIEDPLQTLGVIHDRFTHLDFTRKN